MTLKYILVDESHAQIGKPHNSPDEARQAGVAYLVAQGAQAVAVDFEAMRLWALGDNVTEDYQIDPPAQVHPMTGRDLLIAPYLPINDIDYMLGLTLADLVALDEDARERVIDWLKAHLRARDEHMVARLMNNFKIDEDD